MQNGRRGAGWRGQPLLLRRQSASSSNGRGLSREPAEMVPSMQVEVGEEEQERSMWSQDSGGRPRRMESLRSAWTIVRHV